MYSKNLILRFIAALLFAASAHAQDWQAVNRPNSDGITLYTQAVPGHSFKNFKGVVIIHAPLKEALTPIMSRPYMTTWFYNLKEAYTLKHDNSDESLGYWRIKGVWPTLDRDMVLRTTVSQDPVTLAVQIDARSAENALVPENKDCVRLTSAQTIFVLKPIDKDHTEVTLSGNGDPGGSVPSWIANSFLLDTPLHSLSNLKHLVETPGKVDASILEATQFAINTMKRIQLP